jgi:hypothetical protein
LKAYCTGYSFVRSACPVTCGTCPPAGGASSICQDEAGYRNAYRWSCSTSCKYLRYLPRQYQADAEKKCPKSCGKCK